MQDISYTFAHTLLVGAVYLWGSNVTGAHVIFTCVKIHSGNWTFS